MAELLADLTYTTIRFACPPSQPYWSGSRIIIIIFSTIIVITRCLSGMLAGSESTLVFGWWRRMVMIRLLLLLPIAAIVDQQLALDWTRGRGVGWMRGAAVRIL
jgi:hypothetical protein